jgi:hypothetical protein
MISDNDFDRLVALGRRKGSLDLDDIKHEMPVEEMTTEDLAGLIILLEEHGIAIDLDPELLLPRKASPTILSGQPVILPPSELPPIVPIQMDTGTAHSTPRAVEHAEEARDDDGRHGFSVDIFVYAMAVGLILFLMAWAAWAYFLR